MRIALLGKSLISWGGGIELLRFFANALTLCNEKNEHKIFLLIPEKRPLITKIREFFRPVIDKLGEAFFARKKDSKSAKIERTLIIDSFKNISGNIDIVFYNDSRSGLISCLKTIEADVVLPAINSLGKDFPIPWIGYIYDFQHKYYPEFFTPTEREKRDKNFAVMLEDASAVVVNARSVKEDIHKYYPEAKCKIFNLPFAPTPIHDWFQPSEEDLNQKYKIPQRYFIISNQFWIHKDHATAFRALAILKNKLDTDVALVCTGNTHDYRFPNYFSDLKTEIEKLGISKDVHFLGYIPKIDQIQVLRKAIALLQPTLFEGGPGGFAVYDAVALGVPAIVSDIPINKEIVGEDVIFFKSRSPEDLANRMQDVIEHSPKSPVNQSVLLEAGRIRTERLGQYLLEMVTYMVKK